MRFRRGTSVLLTTALCRSLRFLFGDFLVRMWRVPWLLYLNLPLAVFLKRLEALFLVLTLAMMFTLSYSYSLLLPAALFDLGLSTMDMKRPSIRGGLSTL